MKGKIIQLLLSVIFWLSLLFVSGDLKQILEKLKSKAKTADGSVTVDNIRFMNTPQAQTLSFTVCNGTADDICYNSEYDLFSSCNNAYQPVPGAPAAVPETSEIIPAGESKEIVVTLTDRFYPLPQGAYRLTQVFGALAMNVDFTV